MKLTAFHHLTAVTADARGNLQFYTKTLGLRLIKKTVNQDEVSAYHLFYGDGLASPGTDVTFFDWPLGREQRGGRSIVRTGLRVDTAASLEFWAGKLRELGVAHGGIKERDRRAVLDFEDPEGQRLSLCVDERKGGAHAWEKSPIPSEHQIRGLGPIAISVSDIAPTEQILVSVMGMRRAREFIEAGVQVVVFEFGDAGAAGELHVRVEPSLPRARLGSGGVHHVAFRVPTFEEYDRWNARLQEMGVASSGPVDRFYFKSLYFREPSGILFELATDGPGFATDEAMGQLGEKLSLPPFLESQRSRIEAGLKAL